MYIMLSIEATVYADSNDKYSSLLITKKQNGILIRYLNIVLLIYRCLEFSTWGNVYIALVKCPVTDSVWRGLCVSHGQQFA